MKKFHYRGTYFTWSSAVGWTCCCWLVSWDILRLVRQQCLCHHDIAVLVYIYFCSRKTNRLTFNLKFSRAFFTSHHHGHGTKLDTIYTQPAAAAVQVAQFQLCVSTLATISPVRCWTPLMIYRLWSISIYAVPPRLLFKERWWIIIPALDAFYDSIRFSRELCGCCCVQKGST